MIAIRQLQLIATTMPSCVDSPYMSSSAQHFRPALYDNQLVPLAWWRGGATVGRRICDHEVAVRAPVGAQLRNDCGQVTHTHLPRRRVFVPRWESLNWVAYLYFIPLMICLCVI